MKCRNKGKNGEKRDVCCRVEVAHRWPERDAVNCCLANQQD